MEMSSFLKKILFPKQVSLENQILFLIDETKEFLLPKDIENIRYDIENDEFGLAFETVCAQLFEYETSISLETYTRIDKLGNDLGLDENYWTFLKTSIIND